MVCQVFPDILANFSSTSHVLTRAFRSTLTAAEKSDYLGATLCLMDPVQSPSISQYAGSKTIWGDLQVAHVAQVQFVHRVGAFLPWHRWFMTVHENLLREQCGYTGPLP